MGFRKRMVADVAAGRIPTLVQIWTLLRLLDANWPQIDSAVELESRECQHAQNQMQTMFW